MNGNDLHDFLFVFDVAKQSFGVCNNPIDQGAVIDCRIQRQCWNESHGISPSLSDNCSLPNNSVNTVNPVYYNSCGRIL